MIYFISIRNSKKWLYFVILHVMSLKNLKDQQCFLLSQNRITWSLSIISGNDNPGYFFIWNLRESNARICYKNYKFFHEQFIVTAQDMREILASLRRSYRLL